MNTEEKRIMDGILFSPGAPELVQIKRRAHDLNRSFNVLSETETQKRAQILDELLGSLGERSFLQGPVTFHYGIHTHIGQRTFINFNLTVQDDAPVYIGDDCNIGPNCTIVTPIHPMLPGERKAVKGPDGKPKHVIWAKPVTIGSGCWLGANVVVCPGVTIGENAVIGAGSVVTRDIPANTLAAGVPCRVKREITEKDSLIYQPEILADCSVYEEEL